MKYTTELMTFAVKIGKESRASEWMLALQSRQAECVEALDEEAMHYESIFRSERDGRMYLSWFSVQGTEGAHVSTSPVEIDELHKQFWNECIDRAVPAGKFEHIVSFIPESIQDAIQARSNDLSKNAPEPFPQKDSPAAVRLSQASAVMQVTHAVPEDARAVAEIHVDTWRAAYASIVSAEYLAAQSVERRQVWWSQCIAAGTPELLVAKDKGMVQGWLNFGASRDDGALASEAEIWAIYVAPAFWSTGTGRLLWLRAKELMVAQGFRSCSLWVFPQNARAIKFYQSVGFAADPSPPKSFELGGQQLQEVRYVCQLEGVNPLAIRAVPAHDGVNHPADGTK